MLKKMFLIFTIKKNIQINELLKIEKNLKNKRKNTFNNEKKIKN